MRKTERCKDTRHLFENTINPNNQAPKRLQISRKKTSKEDENQIQFFFPHDILPQMRIKTQDAKQMDVAKSEETE